MINDRPDDTAKPKADAEEIENARLMPELKMMAAALWSAPVRNALFLLCGSFISGHRRYRLRSNPAERLESALL